MKEEIKQKVNEILQDYDRQDPISSANTLREFWLTFTPKSIHVIKAEQREMQETMGIPVPVLKEIGKVIAKNARKSVDNFLPLAETLWNEFGREGRVVSVYPLGAMELVQPARLVPLIKNLCQSCITWEDADQLAMYAFEPIVRKDPQSWLGELEDWAVDENKWVRRASITVAGRLAMKFPEYTTDCLKIAKGMLLDEERDVKKAVSFGIRLAARGDVKRVVQFLKKEIPSKNTESLWVLCDVIRNMSKKLLPEFTDLLPIYQIWAMEPTLSSHEKRTIESAVKTLRSIQ